jgi:outer membrane receptor protein involved in Fe transport
VSIATIFAAAVVSQAAPVGVTSYPAAFFAPAQPSTALDMINRVPGFSLDTGAAVRGFGGAAGNVLIDGVRPPAKGDPLDQILQRIPASSVERIDVIRAGTPGIDMQGKTVLANVIRRQDITAKATLTATGTHGYDGRLSGQFRLQGEKRIGAAELEGSLLAARFLDDGAGTGIWTRVDGQGVPIVRAADITKGYEINYKGTGSVELPAFGGKLRINASYLIDPYHYTQRDELMPPPGGDFERLDQRQNTAEVGVRFERPLGARASLETYGLQQFGRFRLADAFTSDPATAALTGDAQNALFNLHKSTSESVARAVIKYSPAASLSFETGLEGDYNWLRTRTAFVQDGAPVTLPAADVVVTELRGEAFATAVLQVRPSLTLEAGLRAEASRVASSGDVVSGRSLYYPKPRLVIAWSPDPADQVRFRAEREVGQLNFDDFTAQAAAIGTGTVHAGNPRLDPQQDWVIEAAFDRKFWGGGDATATLRHYWYSNVEDRIGVASPSGVFDAPGNIGAGSEDDAAFALTLPTDRLGLKHGQLTGQATFRRSRVIDPTTGQPRGISGLHGSDWEAHFSQGVPRWKATWGVDVIGQMGAKAYRFNEIDTDKIKTYVDLFAQYQPRADLTLRIDLLNASARGFDHFRQVYGGPRNQDPLIFAEARDLENGRFVRLTLIKQFG